MLHIAEIKSKILCTIWG